MPTAPPRSAGGALAVRKPEVLWREPVVLPLLMSVVSKGAYTCCQKPLTYRLFGLSKPIVEGRRADSNR